MMYNNDLIQRFNKGHEKALESIFMEFRAPLCLLAAGIVENEKEAEDIVQDAFVKLWQLRANFSSFNTIKAFLYLAVKNSSRNAYKHRQVKERYAKRAISVPGDNNPVNHFAHAELLRFIYCGLQKLPDGCRKVIQLSYLEGLSNQQVADTLHISVNTVKTQKMRGLRLLRASLGEAQAAYLS